MRDVLFITFFFPCTLPPITNATEKNNNMQIKHRKKNLYINDLSNVADESDIQKITKREQFKCLQNYG